MMNPIGLISLQFVRPFAREHLALFARIKSLGFDFVELLVPEAGELDLAETRSALQEAELGVVLAARVSLQRNIASEDKAARTAGIDYLKQAIDTAAAVGAEIVGGPLYGNPLIFAGRAPVPVSEEERLRRLERCRQGLESAARHASSARVGLAVEPLNRFETDLVSTARQGMELVESLPPTVGLLLDTFHMSMEEASMADAIHLAGARLMHFQANENHRGFPGTGSVNWGEVARALNRVGYSGPLSLEPFRRSDERFGVPFSVWRPPVENEDDRLRASLQLLRSHLQLAGPSP